MLSGSNRLYPIVGDPIAQVKSPAGVTEMLQSRGVNGICIPAHVSPLNLADFMRACLIMQNVDGIIITIPHKNASYTYCKTTSQRSHALKSVNVMRRNLDGTFHGDALDGLAFTLSCEKKGFDFKGKRGLLIGAGGAGAAIAESSLSKGLKTLEIFDIDPSRKTKGGTTDPTGFDIVMNATPLGMKASDPMPFQVEKLTGQFVGDVVTMPSLTPLVDYARKHGCLTSTGLDMFAEVRELIIDFLLEK
jgi:shikimate dehydrogenase